ncbi:uncharacterized protein LOC117529801 [Thalassophryne amazonica]|uniref:uncharacterized protein LOC117529801 n=1 Tax=Thalassophryne amazonica TaxID=390379 RepID=UPI0014713787|nr:uncharacterized protein LOC117529801 [Thalassophryne amazonica]
METRQQLELTSKEVLSLRRDLGSPRMKHVRQLHDLDQTYLEREKLLKNFLSTGTHRGLFPPPFVETDSCPPENFDSRRETLEGSPHDPPPHTQPLSVLTDRELDKLSQNITRFEPSPDGSLDTGTYLNNIKYFLRKFPQVTSDHFIYLVRRISSCEVSRFLERQPEAVRQDIEKLCMALEKEFSNPAAQTGLAAALKVKQGRKESPRVYYNLLLLAYFGTRNEPDMEEDLSFRTLFVENLHPAPSFHLGILGDPKEVDIQCLRDLALKGFTRQQKRDSKATKHHSVLSVNTQLSALERKGAPCGPPKLTTGATSSSPKWKQKFTQNTPSIRHEPCPQQPWSPQNAHYLGSKSDPNSKTQHGQFAPRCREKPTYWERQTANQHQSRISPADENENSVFRQRALSILRDALYDLKEENHQHMADVLSITCTVPLSNVATSFPQPHTPEEGHRLTQTQIPSPRLEAQDQTPRKGPPFSSSNARGDTVYLKEKTCANPDRVSINEPGKQKFLCNLSEDDRT